MSTDWFFIIGAGDHAAVVIDAVAEWNMVIIDAFHACSGCDLLGIPMVTGVSAAAKQRVSTIYD